ncbi:MAG TPA: glycine C-acetyltransferase [Thermoanaerobaculia bacterium]|nr:glycine C-acetyltransferase [Thermoanaerobaculia bacterium]HUM28894.1 glycine C-acetyltransferase [Thermoanaerobaculia bacterium]HXK67173.1 glycine C-acetyltransferase [Thermoanaerobaculia bacterium]
MFGSYGEELRKTMDGLKQEGLYKDERIISGPQGAEIDVKGVGKVINFCANNYLGLSSHPDVIKAAHQALDQWGYGMSSVRFICGTQEIHKTLEKKVAEFLSTDDTILYAACFDANGGVFEPFLDEDCAIITDALNHASIIDGIRLTKAKRFIYQHADLADLEGKLKESSSLKRRIVATDGVFSMDGDYAPLAEIHALTEQYDAILMVDDSHASGFVGRTGRGTHERAGLLGKVDLITTTFGKALGGAMGGCVSGRMEMIEWLRQRSRPYLFSNSLSPVVAGTSVAVIDLLSRTTELRDRLFDNTRYFRSSMESAGFDIKPGDHPIVPIMLYDAKVAKEMADRLLSQGIYVIGFSFPVVPKGQARIRVQVSAVHERKHLDRCIDAFTHVAKEMGVLS